MNIQPLFDRVLVKRLETEEKTAGGIFIPDTAKEKPVLGEVIAVGPGRMSEEGKQVPMTVKKGDVVLFTKYVGNEVPGDDDMVIMSEDNILATVKQ
jgi:Co-chaperonin GroES (HSP10)